MEEVGYIEPAHPAFGLRPVSSARPAPDWDDDRSVDLRDSADPITPMLERAMGEQLAEQRMIREALIEFDRRLEILERSVADRVVDLEHEVGQRVEYFERSITERMAAFEAVLKRLVERVGGAEERLMAGMDHSDKVLRAHLEALRPSFEATIDRVVEWIEQLDEANLARQGTLRESVEGSVARVEEMINRAQHTIETQMAALAALVESAASAPGAPEPGAPEPVERFPGFEPVRGGAPVAARIVDTPEPVRKRPRPLRAKRVLES